MHSEISSFEPRIGIESPGALIIKMLFEGLTRIEPDGKVQLAIAKSYALSENQKTYTFTLKSTQWSNGEEVTAYDFEYAWKKVVDPKFGSLGVQNFYPIKNVQAIIEGKKPIEELGVKALDKYTLKVELERPTHYFLEILSIPSFFPINSRLDQENSNWAREVGDSFVCNGPFKLTKHHFECEIVMKKNPRYWDFENVSMPEIQIAIVKDPILPINLFEKKEIDWVGRPFASLAVDSMLDLKRKGALEHPPCYGVYWYFINTQTFPFSNKKIRKAFTYAVNRQAIIENILDSGEIPALRILPQYFSLTPSSLFKDNNQELALKLFNEALEDLGLKKEELPQIHISLHPTGMQKIIAQAIQQQWNQLFDLNIKLDINEGKVSFANLLKGKFQIGGCVWVSWIRDPIYFMQTFRDKSDGVNISNWENEEYKRLLKLAENELNLEKRKSLFLQAESLLLDEMPVIPIYGLTIPHAKNPKLKNVYISELNDVDFRWSYFEEE